MVKTGISVSGAAFNHGLKKSTIDLWVQQIKKKYDIQQLTKEVNDQFFELEPDVRKYRIRQAERLFDIRLQFEFWLDDDKHESFGLSVDSTAQ